MKTEQSDDQASEEVSSYMPYSTKDISFIRRCLSQGHAHDAIAIALERSPVAISMLAHRLQWSQTSLKNRRRRYTEKEDRFIIKWSQQGVSQTVIGKALGRTRSAIAIRLHRLTWGYA